MKQMTLLDLIPMEVTVGVWLTDEQIDAFKGDVIPFRDLENYIEQKVIEELPREGAVSCRVVLIKRYLKECDKVYGRVGDEVKVIGICDRVGMSDDKRRGKENMWCSEMFCEDGRWCATTYPARFYRLKGAE